jgi:phosphoglycolate phosphatase
LSRFDSGSSQHVIWIRPTRNFSGFTIDHFTAHGLRSPDETARSVHWKLARSLVLFDIDGTLVRRTGPYHRQALVQAVRDVAGIETTTEGIPVHGMLDPDILNLMLQAVGIDAGRVPGLMPNIIERAQEIYETIAPDLRSCACPGAADILCKLKDNGAVLALVTGNLTRIGWRKLARAGLDSFFRFGAFGEMAPTRGGLARIAIERACGEKLIEKGSPITLIGDAAQDVRAARENQILAIAVRTGITPAEELESAAPDFIFDDLTHLDPALVTNWSGHILR